MAEPHKRDDTTRHLAVLAILLLGLGGGMELFRWLRNSPSKVGLPERDVFAQAPPQPAPLPPAAAPRPAPGGSLWPSTPPTGQDLLDFLLGQRGRMEALKFASDFLEEPELAKAWKEFKEDKDAARLLRKVRGSEAFARVVAKSAGLPGFRALLDEAAQQPAIREVLERERRATREGPPKGQPGSEGLALTRLAALPDAKAAPGEPTALERRILDQLPADLVARLRAEMAKGKTLRQACAGLEFGQDCEKLPLKGGPAGRAAWGPSLAGGKKKPSLEEGYEERVSTPSAPAPPALPPPPPPKTDGPATLEPAKAGEAPCTQWKQPFVFQCCNVVSCTRCSGDQTQNTNCDPKDWSIVSASCGDMTAFCRTDPQQTTGLKAEEWQQVFGKPAKPPVFE